MQMTTDALSRYGLFWKPSSLQILCAGCLQSAAPDIRVRTLDGECSMHVVTEMIALGTKFDNLGTPRIAPDHRFTQGTRRFGALKKFLLPGLPVHLKLSALSRTCNSVLAFDAGNWLLDKDLLTRVKRLEFNNIRAAFRLRWKEATEGKKRYYIRTARKLRSGSLRQRLHHCTSVS